MVEIHLGSLLHDEVLKVSIVTIMADEGHMLFSKTLPMAFVKLFFHFLFLKSPQSLDDTSAPPCFSPNVFHSRTLIFPILLLLTIPSFIPFGFFLFLPFPHNHDGSTRGFVEAGSTYWHITWRLLMQGRRRRGTTRLHLSIHCGHLL